MPELPTLSLLAIVGLGPMRFLKKNACWIAVWACGGFHGTFAAPVTAPTQAEPPAEQVTSEVRRSDVGPSRGFRGETPRPGEKTVSSDASTGQKNLDLLLDLEGRTSNVNPAGGDEARIDAARAARKRLLEGGSAVVPDRSAPPPSKAILAPTTSVGTELGESTSDSSTEGRRWSGSVGSPTAIQDSGSSSSADTPARHSYSYGADFSHAPTRNFLLLLQEYREWVIAAAVAAGLLTLASRSRRRR